MKRVNKINARAVNELLDSFGILHPLGTEVVYPCPSCGRDTKVKREKLIWCLMCSRAWLHPRYNFVLDKMDA